MKWIEIPPTDTIEDAAIAVVATANHSGEECRAKLNSFTLIAHPLVTDEDDLVRAYFAHLNRNQPPHPGSELASDVIIVLTAMLDSIVRRFCGRDYGPSIAKARQIIEVAMKEPVTGGVPIGAAMHVLRIDESMVHRLNNIQKAALFIAAIELTKERVPRQGG